MDAGSQSRPGASAASGSPIGTGPVCSERDEFGDPMWGAGCLGIDSNSESVRGQSAQKSGSATAPKAGILTSETKFSQDPEISGS